LGACPSLVNPFAHTVPKQVRVILSAAIASDPGEQRGACGCESYQSELRQDVPSLEEIHCDRLFIISMMPPSDAA
jgi:hypothetical protein